jgi:hypothetical protein
MTDANNTITPKNNCDQFKTEKEQMSALFMEIGGEANVLIQMLLDHSDQAESDSYYALLSVAQKIGYLADKGTDHAGGAPVKGGAENWFLPPSYHWAVEARSEHLDRIEA